MKTLLLMRHAKSSWADDSLADHDRPLNNRGKKAAPQMAQWLNSQNIAPQHIISSTANRAYSTAQLVNENISQSVVHQADRRLYLATIGEIAEVIRDIDCQLDQVMLVGHNPGMEATVHKLTSEWETMPTAAIAVVRIPLEHWFQLESSTACELLHFWRPKELE